MRFPRLLSLFSLVLTLLFGLWLPAAIAELPARTAIVLDGRPLITLSDAGQFSSQERAALVSKQLAEAIDGPQPLKFSVEQRNQQPMILLNDRALLTVTNRDSALEITVQEQAQLWVQQLQQAVQQAQIERSPAVLQKMVLIAGGLGVLAIALHWLLGKIVQYISQAVLRRLALHFDESSLADSSKPIEFLFKLTLFLARTGLWVSCSLYIANLFPWTRQLSYQIADLLRTSLIYPILTLGKKAYSVTDLLILGVVLMGWIGLASTLSNLLKTRVLGLANISRGPQETITTLARYSLILLGSIMLLQAWGIDISSLAILASVFGLGIGLGLQNIAKNFSSGLVLVLERPIQVGDFIEVGKHKGTVERIGARSTQIRTLDYISIIVPNSRFLEDEVINWSHDTPMSRLHLPVGVAYGSDPKEVEAALLTVARQHPQVIDSPTPQVMFMRFGDSALDFELLVWTQDPSKELPLKSELYYQIYDILKQKQIEIPFPQRDLHIRSSSLRAIEIEKILERIATASESDRHQT